MKRKLGTVKVYMSVKDGVETYETVWPRKLYLAVNGRTSTAQHLPRSVFTWSKRLAAPKLTPWKKGAT